MALTDAEVQALTLHASRVRECAHVPYSGYRVGAAVVTENGRVYFGCNVENSSYGLTLCAERAAMASAVCGGAARIRAIVVVMEGEEPQAPCGACRQWMAEFGGPATEIVVASAGGVRRTYTLGQLLPDAFRLDQV